MFAADRILRQHHGPVVLWGRELDRRISGEFNNYNLADDTELHRFADIQLRELTERSWRNQRDCDRQSSLERWNKYLFLDDSAGVCEQPEVQRIWGNCKSVLRREVDPISVAVTARINEGV